MHTSRHCPNGSDSRNCPIWRRTPSGWSPSSTALNDDNLRGRFELGHDQAKRYANEALELAPKFTGNSNYGTAIYSANMTLSALALRDGDRKASVLYLQRASEAPSSERLGCTVTMWCGTGSYGTWSRKESARPRSRIWSAWHGRASLNASTCVSGPRKSARRRHSHRRQRSSGDCSLSQNQRLRIPFSPPVNHLSRWRESAGRASQGPAT